MNSNLLSEKQKLALSEQEGHDAQKMLDLLAEFDEQYSQAIISNILSCDPKDFEGWRNLLKAKEAFISFLTDKVTNGDLASDRMIEIDKDNARELLNKYEEVLLG